MSNDRIEYVFKVCNCRRSDFVYGSAAKRVPVCPEHGTRLLNKIRWCSICDAETLCSNYSNSKKFVCKKCRRANNLATKKAWQRNNKTPRTNYGLRANTGLKRSPEAEKPLFERILNKRFPPLKMPTLSKGMMRIYNDHLQKTKLEA